MVTILLFNILEHKRMVTQFTQLDNSVHQRLCATLAFIALLRTVSQQNPFALHVSKKLKLHTITSSAILFHPQKQTYLYNTRCNPDISHLIIYSTLSGNCDSTSFFRRLSKNGRNTLCKRRMIRMVSSSFNSTYAKVCYNKILTAGIKNSGPDNFRTKNQTGTDIFCETETDPIFHFKLILVPNLSL